MSIVRIQLMQQDSRDDKKSYYTGWTVTKKFLYLKKFRLQILHLWTKKYFFDSLLTARNLGEQLLNLSRVPLPSLRPGRRGL